MSAVSRDWKADGCGGGDGNHESRSCRNRSAHRGTGVLRSQLTGAAVSESQQQALRRVLYGLYAVVTVHFAKEEEVYLPILDARLTREEAAQEAKSKLYEYR